MPMTMAANERVDREGPWWVSVGLVLGACAQTPVSDPSPGERVDNGGERPAAIGTWTTEPSAESRALLQRAEGYEEWPVFAEHAERPQRSRGHEMWVVTHFNMAAAPGVMREDAEFPDGSMLVKENRPEPDAPPELLTTMSKVGGTWHWLAHTPAGEVVVRDGVALEGQVERCIACHSDAPRDMVFGGIWP
jgi:hypothetical protein